MRTKFLVADEVKPDASGKQNVRGLFPDDTIVITLPPSYSEGSGSLPPGMDLLTCMLSVMGLPSGRHRIQGKLRDPRGNLNSETPVVDFDIADGGSHTFPFTLQPFIISGGAGRYTWTFQVDTSICTHSFEVRLVKANS